MVSGVLSLLAVSLFLGISTDTGTIILFFPLAMWMLIVTFCYVSNLSLRFTKSRLLAPVGRYCVTRCCFFLQNDACYIINNLKRFSTLIPKSVSVVKLGQKLELLLHLWSVHDMQCNIWMIYFSTTILYKFFKFNE